MMFRRGDPETLVRATARFGVKDDRVLDAVRQVDRRDFVPEGSEHRAYRDRPIPIPNRQTTSQPSLVAAMVDALELADTDRALEIGTGLGYQAALLSRLAAAVWTVERFEDLAGAARINLEEAGYDNVTVVHGDGTRGLPEHAPYHGIVVAAAFPDVPEPLAQQLAEGGRLVQPLGPGGMEKVEVFTKEDGDLVRLRTLTGASFVRLHGEHGYGG